MVVRVLIAKKCKTCGGSAFFGRFLEALTDLLFVSFTNLELPDKTSILVIFAGIAAIFDLLIESSSYI